MGGAQSSESADGAAGAGTVADGWSADPGEGTQQSQDAGADRGLSPLD